MYIDLCTIYGYCYCLESALAAIATCHLTWSVVRAWIWTGNGYCTSGEVRDENSPKTTEKQVRLSYSMYEEQNVVSDGEFEIPALVEDQAHS